MRLVRPGSRTRAALKRARPLAAAVRAARRVRQQVSFSREYTPDRHVLEQVIFPLLLEREDMQRILFVGCDWYTQGYPDRFHAHEFWTIDIDPAKARYGSERHVVDSLANVRAYFDEASLDAVICSGVFGWGLDGREETESALTQCFECLRPGGLFVLGWNDVDEGRPPHLWTSPSLKRLRPVTLPPFPGPRYPTFSHLRHVFDFYERPRSEASS